jgi:tetratricopeptide (TPR) repeat protein
MKRTERRHLKENELAAFATNAREVIERRRRETTLIALAVLVVGAVVLGYLAWTSRVEGRASALLADAVAVDQARVGPPPAPGTPASGLSFPTEREKHQAALTKFKTVADEYPRTDSGLFARYREGSTEMALGNYEGAIRAYQDVIDHGGRSIHAEMARLGLAEAQARAGQYDRAIEMYRSLADNKDGRLPVDGILMELGRAYLDAGKRTEAQQTFNRVVAEFPDSPFSAEARRELDSLKKT